MVTIRDAEEEDVNGLLEVFKEFLDYHGEIDPLYTRSKEAHIRFEGRLRECMASPDHLVLVAVEDGRVVGYSLVGIGHYPPVLVRECFGSVSDLAVTFDHRRKGIGTALMDRNMEWFRERGLDRVELRVLAHNDATNGFWRGMGFSDYIHQLFLEL